jgi:hypothetical protein
MTVHTVVALVAGLAGTCAQFDHRYVNGAAPPGGDGLSWATAFRDLQPALDSAPVGAYIWVAQGTYTPTRLASPPDPASATYEILSFAHIHGGFVGNETDLSQADPAAHPTVLSGGGFLPRIMTVREASDVHGVRFQGSLAPGSGGGALTVLSTPAFTGFVVTDCTFSQNAGNQGAAIHVIGGSASFDRCVIGPNTVLAGGQAGVVIESSTIFSRCLLTGNSGSLTQGAAVRLLAGAPAEFHGCSFVSNNAPDGVGAAVYGDGALFGSCTFMGNTAIAGGAVFGGGHRFFSCAFAQNRSFDTPGVVAGAGNTFLNCTFKGNIAEAQQGGGGVGAITGGGSTLLNCILWDNCGGASCGTEATQIGGTATINFSTVRGWTGAYGGAGNNGVDPQFADGLGRLAAASPAIDAGDSAVGFQVGSSVAPLDADRLARYFETAAPNTGNPLGRAVDRGAYEFGAPAYLCYLNLDYSTAAPVLNILDFNTFVNLFSAGHPLANCDHSTGTPVLTVLDFNCFINRFVAGCSPW